MLDPTINEHDQYNLTASVFTPSSLDKAQIAVPLLQNKPDTDSESDNDSDNDSESDNKTDVVKVGVSKYKNIMGITCYMNSILHILQQTPIFMEYISQAKFKHILDYKIIYTTEEEKESKLKEFVIFELFRLFKASLEHDDTAITPTSFKAIIGTKNDMWNEYNHQDSQEFFTFLISQLEEEVGIKCTFVPGNTSHSSDNTLTLAESFNNIVASDAWLRFQLREFSPLKNLFDGLTQIHKKCVCCGCSSYGFEPFITWGVDVPIKGRTDMAKSFSIYDCIDNMVSQEQLDQDNKMICELCGLKNRAYSQSLLWKTPKILVIHIKRFLVNSFGIPTQKITNNIEYPIKDLDLSKYFDPASPYKSNSKYDLIGVNMHQAFGYGTNINSGHYTSIVKNIMNNNWYLYNDANELKMAFTKQNLQNSNAYMLFYYRHD